MDEVAKAFALKDHAKYVLEQYYNGDPLKDYWRDKDTIEMMELFVYLVDNWSGYE